MKLTLFAMPQICLFVGWKQFQARFPMISLQWWSNPILESPKNPNFQSIAFHQPGLPWNSQVDFIAEVARLCEDYSSLDSPTAIGYFCLVPVVLPILKNRITIEYSYFYEKFFFTTFFKETLTLPWNHLILMTLPKHETPPWIHRYFFVLNLKPSKVLLFFTSRTEGLGDKVDSGLLIGSGVAKRPEGRLIVLGECDSNGSCQMVELVSPGKKNHPNSIGFGIQGSSGRKIVKHTKSWFAFCDMSGLRWFEKKWVIPQE